MSKPSGSSPGRGGSAVRLSARAIPDAAHRAVRCSHQSLLYHRLGPDLADQIEITVKREDHGLVSRWLHDVLKPGDEVEIEAPNGTFTFTGKEAESSS